MKRFILTYKNAFWYRSGDRKNFPLSNLLTFTCGLINDVFSSGVSSDEIPDDDELALSECALSDDTTDVSNCPRV